jgi:hypothetical protein
MSVLAKFISADGLSVLEEIPERLNEVRRTCMYPITSSANEINVRQTLRDRKYRLMGPLNGGHGRVYEYREVEP